MFFRKKIANKYLIFISIFFLMLGVGIIFLYFNKLINQTFFMIALFISLMGFTTTISAMFNRFISQRLNNKRQGKKFSYQGEVKMLDYDSKVEENFGEVYVKQVVKTIYSLTIVNDINLFFSEDSSKHVNQYLSKKMSRSIQFYVFDSSNKDQLSKILMLNYQAKNFYIAAFLHDKDKELLIHVDKVEANLEFEPYVNKMYQMIGLNNEN